VRKAEEQELLTADPVGVAADHGLEKFTGCSRVGLERTHRPHDLRHSCATYLLAAGVSEKEIMDILGHTNLAMTRHYEHVLDGMRAAAADRLETWFGAHIGAAEAP
jgi:Phage integrase family